MKPLFHRPVRLSALTVFSVTAACVAAVSACVMIFATVYSKAVLRDAQVNVEQTVAQTAVSVENSLNAMKYRLSRVAVLAGRSSDSAQFGSAIAALTDVENDIFAVTVYGISPVLTTARTVSPLSFRSTVSTASFAVTLTLPRRSTSLLFFSPDICRTTALIAPPSLSQSKYRRLNGSSNPSMPISSP